MDKSYDLLSETPSIGDHEHNITRKAVINRDSFSRFMNIADKNKKNLVYHLKVNDLLQKSHTIISLKIEGTNYKNDSRIDFVELCGSEQAIASDTQFKGESVKDFITRSFNSLSSGLVRAALNKKPKH